VIHPVPAGHPSNDSSDDSQTFQAVNLLTFLPSTPPANYWATLCWEFFAPLEVKKEEKNPKKKKNTALFCGVWGIRGKFAHDQLRMTGKHSDVMSFQLVFN